MDLDIVESKPEVDDDVLAAAVAIPASRDDPKPQTLNPHAVTLDPRP